VLHIAPDFRPPARRGKGHIAGYVTLCATPQAGEKTSKMVILLREIALARNHATITERTDLRLFNERSTSEENAV
jgi:hypothetical protein